MKEKLDKIFQEKKNEFDFEEPNVGHFNRFEAKLNTKSEPVQVKKTPWHWLAIAASVLLFFGYWLGNSNSNKGLELADVSPKMEETQGFYLATIHREIEVIKKQETTQNKQIIEDAFAQLEKLENNYQKLTLELKESNEDKRVVYAMISNFQRRLEVLQNLVDRLEELENRIPEEYKV